MTGFLIYGAYGYTGSLIAHAAVRRGMKPVLAGRNPQRLEHLAAQLGLEWRACSLDDPTQLQRTIRDAGVVLHCAGPFSRTARPMAEACLRAGSHYLDITGEAAVFEEMARRGREAEAAGIMLLPGAGFDIVPSDCLAVHLKRRLPSATRLALGFQSLSRLSRGTALTVLENLARQGLVRENGALRRVPAAWKTRTIDFGAGAVTAMTIPWGDVVTAYHSTGIGNIEFYMAAPLSTRLAARLSRYAGGLLGSNLVQKMLANRIRAGPAGPSADERQCGRSYLWGEVSDAAGRRCVARLRGPEGYDFTVAASLALVTHVLGGSAPRGYQTPASAYGPDFVLELAGVKRADEPA